MIAEHIKLQLSDKARYPYNGPRPSNLSSCVRFIWYTNFTPEALDANPPELELLFREGNLFEEDIIHLIEDSGYTISDRQSKVVASIGQHRIPGFIDGVVSLGNLSKSYALEVKSMGPEVFKKFTTSGMEGVPYYLDQFTTYLIGCEEKFNINEGILFAKNRDNGDIADVYFSIDLDLVEALKQSLDKREEVLLDSDNPPQRPYSRNSYNCEGCPAKVVCWGIETSKSLTLEDLEPSEAKEIVDASTTYADLVVKLQDLTDSKERIRESFDTILEKYKATSLIINSGQDLTIRPNIRSKTYKKLNELKLASQHPEDFQSAKYTEKGTELRVEIRWKGQLISQ